MAMEKIDNGIGDEIAASFLKKLKIPLRDEAKKRKRLNSFLLKQSFGFVVHQDTFYGSGIEHDPLQGQYLTTFFSSFLGAEGNETLLLCGGQGSTKTLAQIKAIMEYIERYALRCKLLLSPVMCEESLQCRDVLSLLDEKKISKQCINDINLYSIWATNVLIEQKELIPLQSIYDINSILNKKSENGFRAISTGSGMAAHFDAGEALKRGTLELIERDAFMRWWLCPESGVVINVPSVKKKSERIKNCLSLYLDNDDIEIRLIQLSSPVNIPVVIAIATSSNFKKPPALLLGASSGFDLKEVAARAIEELGIATLNIVARFQKDSQWLSKPPDLSSLGSMNSPQDHMYLYHHPELLEHLLFLPEILNQKPTKIIVDGPSSMDELKEALKAKKMDLCVLDVTPEIFQEYGVTVVRCFIPQLHQLYFGFPLPTNMKEKSQLSVADTLPHCFP
jgi:thiazole/oxazole-forming peptide maturase SagD family component